MDDQAIVDEVQQAIWALGGCARPTTPSMAYLILERLNADPALLEAVRAWGETGKDEAVLELLRDWNEAACETAVAG
jgi:hypothetical protein